MTDINLTVLFSLRLIWALADYLDGQGMEIPVDIAFDFNPKF